ncbi:MAG: beta-galactosidase [Clostridia bacterium]|nr:beta-galactosidase [Clostridia bacterium]
MTKELFKKLGVLHGGDYNPDQWLNYPDVLQKDIELMKKANINCVSLGIFSWAKLEPKEGVYDFDWLEQIINNLYENGIYVLLATPSGSKPKWMSEKYTEIRRVSKSLVRDLSGNRHNHCFTSPVYRQKVREINTRLAQRFADHPAVIMWHISNEYGGECFCPLCQQAFREWLKQKYKTIENLNRAWWTDFWSHTFGSFEEINAPVPNGEVAIHALNLDWRRFTTHQTVDFMKAEIDAVRSVNKNIPVTTNMMGTYYDLDYFKFGSAIDIAAYDSYPNWKSGDNTDVAAGAAFSYDLTRGVKGENWLLMESTPAQTNWHPVCKLKRPGQHEASSLQAVAHGSNSVQYFQIRKSRGAAEKFHGAVIDHVGTDETRVFKDVAALGGRLKALSCVAQSQVNSQVAIVFDWENRWAIDTAMGPRNSGIHYVETVMKHHRAFWDMGINTDVIDMECDISKYKVVIAPMLYMYRAGFEQKMREFVEKGGVLVTTYHSGMVDSTDLCYLGGWPGGGMGEVFGIWNEEIDALYDNECNSMDYMGKEYKLKELCALVHAKTAKVLASYKEDFYAGMPALTVNEFGKGKAYYMASLGDNEFFKDFYSELVKESGVEPALKVALPYGVTAHSRSGDKHFVFVENYSGEEKTVELGDEYTNAETNKPVTSLKLKPFDIVVLEK